MTSRVKRAVKLGLLDLKPSAPKEKVKKRSRKKKESKKAKEN